MIDEEKLYFINIPPEVQDEIYSKTLEYLNELNIDYNTHIYLVSTPIVNDMGKFYFKCYLRNEPGLSKSLNDKSDFIIFYS